MPEDVKVGITDKVIIFGCDWNGRHLELSSVRVRKKRYAFCNNNDKGDSVTKLSVKVKVRSRLSASLLCLFFLC